MRTDDSSIISECLNGEPGAFGLLVDKYKEGIYAFVYDKLRNFQDAQDVTQEVFIQAYRGLRTLRRWESFSFWLYRIAYARCKLWIRTQSRRVDRDFIEDQEPEVLEDYSISSHSDDQLHESVEDALNSLPQTYHEVLTLYYFGGMNSIDIANALGTSPAAIRHRLSRGRARLKEEMIAMMDTAYEGQKLPAGFTFRIIEAVKRIKINPMPRSTALPWGLSAAVGIIITVLGLSPNLNINSNMDIPYGAPLTVETKVLKTGEIPVDILDISKISVIASKKTNNDNSQPESPNNALFLAPQVANGKWTRKADMSLPRNMHASCAVGGEIYAIGGANAGHEPIKTMEEYDPAANTWIKKADMPTPRLYLSACSVGEKIYVVGGWNWAIISDTEEYDPVTDTWTRKSNMPTARDGLTTSMVDGKIYAIGGWNQKAFSVVEEYDLATDKWTKKADMPTARWGHSASVVNGKIYVMGGRTGTFNQGPPFSIVEEYDPVTDTWARKTDMPTARWGLSACVLNGKIYAIGGTPNESTNLSVVEEYDSITDTWMERANMPTARTYFSASEANGKIYAVGGSTANGNTSSVEEYDPEAEAVEAKEKLPTTWGETKFR